MRRSIHPSTRTILGLHRVTSRDSVTSRHDLRPALGALVGLGLGLLVAACGGSSGPRQAQNQPPTAVVTTPAGVQGGNVVIAYTLSDAESDVASVVVEFSLNDGTTFVAATPAAGSEATSGLVTSVAGTAHSFTWASLGDAVAVAAANATVKVRVTPSDAAAGVAATTNAFTVDNTSNTPPTVLSVTSPSTTQTGLVVVPYQLADAQSNPCSLALAYSIDGGMTFAPATVGPGPTGASGLVASPGGTSQTIVWNSFADGVATAGAVSTVQVRLTPSDGTTGSAAFTANFTVNNAGLVGGGMVSGYPVTVNPSGSDDHISSIATDGAYLYAVGRDANTGTDLRWRIEKRNLTTGALVAAFGTAGVVTVNPTGGEDDPESVIVVGSSIYVAGWTDNAPFANEDKDLRIEKRSAVDGSLVAAFGTAGVVAIDLDAGGGAPMHLAADATGLYLAMADHVPGGGANDYRLRLEKRDLTTGAPVATFGTSGLVTQNLDGNADGAIGIAVDGTAIYLVGTQGLLPSTPANSSLRIEKRSPSTGALVGGFGTAGAITEDLSVNDDVGLAVAVDATHLYLLGTNGTPGPGLWTWRFEKRLLTDGSLVASAAGAQTTDSDDLRATLVLAGGSIYATTAAGLAPNRLWRTERRNTADLTLVASFGTGGVVTSDPTVGNDECRSVVVTGGVVVTAGSDTGGPSDQWRVEARWR